MVSGGTGHTCGHAETLIHVCLNADGLFHGLDNIMVDSMSGDNDHNLLPFSIAQTSVNSPIQTLGSNQNSLSNSSSAPMALALLRNYKKNKTAAMCVHTCATRPAFGLDFLGGKMGGKEKNMKGSRELLPIAGTDAICHISESISQATSSGHSPTPADAQNAHAHVSAQNSGISVSVASENKGTHQAAAGLCANSIQVAETRHDLPSPSPSPQIRCERAHTASAYAHNGDGSSNDDQNLSQNAEHELTEEENVRCQSSEQQGQRVCVPPSLSAAPARVPSHASQGVWGAPSPAGCYDGQCEGESSSQGGGIMPYLAHSGSQGSVMADLNPKFVMRQEMHNPYSYVIVQPIKVPGDMRTSSGQGADNDTLRTTSTGLMLSDQLIAVLEAYCTIAALGKGSQLDINYNSRLALGLEDASVRSVMFTSRPITAGSVKRLMQIFFSFFACIYVMLAVPCFIQVGLPAAVFPETKFRHFRFTNVRASDGAVATTPGVQGFGLLAPCGCSKDRSIMHSLPWNPVLHKEAGPVRTFTHESSLYISYAEPVDVYGWYVDMANMGSMEGTSYFQVFGSNSDVVSDSIGRPIPDILESDSIVNNVPDGLRDQQAAGGAGSESAAHTPILVAATYSHPCFCCLRRVLHPRFMHVCDCL